jgi:hypothetical protein
MPFDQFQKNFLFRIAKELDPESSLYEVPGSDRAVGVPVIVECQAAFAAPSETRRNVPGYSQALALRTRALLTVPLPVMTIPDTMN